VRASPSWLKAKVNCTVFCSMSSANAPNDSLCLSVPYRSGVKYAPLCFSFRVLSADRFAAGFARIPYWRSLAQSTIANQGPLNSGKNRPGGYELFGECPDLCAAGRCRISDQAAAFARLCLDSFHTSPSESMPWMILAAFLATAIFASLRCRRKLTLQ